MSFLRSLIWKEVGIGVLAGIGALAMQVHAGSVASPLDVVRFTIEEVLAVLQDPTYRGVLHRRQRMEKLRTIMLPQFDMREMAQRALGLYWRDRTEQERQRFVQLFTDLMETTYAGAFDRYPNDVQVFFDQERIEGAFAHVSTRIVAPSEDITVSVNYRLHKAAGRWLIYDVVIEGVSLVSNYRTQFYRIVRDSSYEGLVQRIEDKLSEIVPTTS